MKTFVGDVCSQTKDLINMIDATMVEAILYARGETLMYSDNVEFQKQMIVQANALRESIDQLDAVIQQNRKFFESANPPENVPGQVLAIAEVIVDKVDQFNPVNDDQVEKFFRTLPEASRHELMARLRAYRDYLLRVAGMERADPEDSNYSTDPLTPYWW